MKTDDLIKRLNRYGHHCIMHSLDGDYADAIDEAKRELKDMNNYICYLCGDYKERHLGRCDGCRWRDAE